MHRCASRDYWLDIEDSEIEDPRPLDPRSSYDPVDHPLRRIGVPLNNVGLVNGVLNRHQIRAYGPEETKCSCDYRWRTHREHQSHLAEALAELLPPRP